MQALLKEQGIWAPLSEQLSKIGKPMLELQEEKTHSLILLSLSDKVLYEVCKELTVVRLSHKLKKLFIMKSISHKLLLK